MSQNVGPMGLVRCNACAHSISAAVLVGCSGAPLPVPRWTHPRHGAGRWSQIVHLGCSKAWRGLRRNGWSPSRPTENGSGTCPTRTKAIHVCSYCLLRIDMILDICVRCSMHVLIVGYVSHKAMADQRRPGHLRQRPEHLQQAVSRRAYRLLARRI